MAERDRRPPPPAAADAAARVRVGRIAGAHGVRGLVRVTSYTEDPMDFAAYGPVSTADGRALAVTPVRMAKSQVLARIEGVDDRDAADALRGADLFVARDALPPTDDDEFYWEDLVGLAAETASGEALGTVLSVQDFGAGEMLEIGPDRHRSVLVPFTREIVPVVDLGAGRIRIDPPEGLFGDGDDAEDGEDGP